MKTKLAAGELATSMIVRLSCGAEIAHIALSAGYDALYVDLEHSPLTLTAAGHISMSAAALGVTPLVRVPGLDAAMIARALDAGALGVIVPGVGNAAEARQAVESALFPPAGRRSITTSLPQLHFRPAGAAELEDVNAATLVGVMIETAGALENAEAIAAVPGIDLLHVGLHDLAASLGYRDRPPDEAVMEALAPVIAAARRHGKHVGIGGAGTAGPLLAALIDAGARYVSAGTDLSFLLAAAGERCAAVRRLFDGGIRPEDHNARQ
ncbi:MAG: aldolase [Mesorhizobium sp.]|nr:aldolase [Mesorhizobium sp.]